VIQYASQVICPYNPKQIVIYCGENDLAGSDTVTAKMVLDRFVQLFNIIRSRLPKTPVAYVSMKPSPSRQHLKAKMEAGNKWIKRFLTTRKKTSFINVYPAMLQNNGKPKGEIFVADSLHMNAKGYAIWQKIIQPYLFK